MAPFHPQVDGAFIFDTIRKGEMKGFNRQQKFKHQIDEVQHSKEN
jgi:hypothetical protein